MIRQLTRQENGQHESGVSFFFLFFFRQLLLMVGNQFGWCLYVYTVHCTLSTINRNFESLYCLFYFKYSMCLLRFLFFFCCWFWLPLFHYINDFHHQDFIIITNIIVTDFSSPCFLVFPIDQFPNRVFLFFHLSCHSVPPWSPSILSDYLHQVT